MPPSAPRHDVTQPLTVTHARLRMAQGDYSTARRILRELLENDPEDQRAWQLWREILASSTAVRRRDEIEEAETPVPATAAGLASEFRRALGKRPQSSPAERLSRLGHLLQRITPNPE